MEAMYVALSRSVRHDIEAHFGPLFWTTSYLYDLEKSGELQSLTAQEFACWHLLEALFKKCTDMVADDARDKAIDLFLKMNSYCATSYQPSPHGEEMVARGRAFLQRIVTDKEGEILSLIKVDDCQFGPGSTLLGNDEAFDTKLGHITHTFTSPFCLTVYRRWLTQCPRLMSIEQSRQKAFGMRRVQASKLSTVPKTTGIDRVICVEPSLNMMVQQAVRRALERSLKRVGIDLSTQQDVQKALARKGSLNGELCTIDLTSASDTISLALARAILPEPLYDVVHEVRTPYVELPGGEQVALSMLSTMGNATTFPIQCLIFLALVRAVYDDLGIPFRPRGPDRNVGVNGDDIIVVAEAYEPVLKLLAEVGFIPNKLKSYGRGRFRESCGGDFLSGVDVRGVYLRSLRGRHNLFSAFNRLLMWSCRHGVALVETLRLLHGSVRNKLYVPYYEDVTAGFWRDPWHRTYKALRPQSVTRPYRCEHTGYEAFLSGRLDRESGLVGLRSRKVAYVVRRAVTLRGGTVPMQLPLLGECCKPVSRPGLADDAELLWLCIVG